MISRIKIYIKHFQSSHAGQLLQLILSVVSETSRVLKLILIGMAVAITVIEDKFMLPVAPTGAGWPTPATQHTTEPYDKNRVFVKKN